VRGIAAIAVLTALLLWVSTPALSCLVTPEKLTEAEMQCCRQMAGHCGEMAKVEHSCCPKTPVKVQSEKKTVLAVTEKPVSVAPVLTPQISTHSSDGTSSFVAVVARTITFESPPGSPLPLRI
jgi:hypothetical protein